MLGSVAKHPPQHTYAARSSGTEAEVSADQVGSSRLQGSAWLSVLSSLTGNMIRVLRFPVPALFDELIPLTKDAFSGTILGTYRLH